MTTPDRAAMPQRMRTLARDRRGYPIPYIVMIDKAGNPQFTINDVHRVMACRRKGLCSICGKRVDLRRIGNGVILPDYWFVGGSRCFLHPHGAFLDPPMHLECAEYALRVCPFLAARRYVRRIDTAKLDPKNLPDDYKVVMEEHMHPRLPERFGLGLCHDYRFMPHGNGNGVYVVSDWRHVEWWKAGEEIAPPDTGVAPPDEPMEL